MKQPILALALLLLPGCLVAHIGEETLKEERWDIAERSSEPTGLHYFLVEVDDEDMEATWGSLLVTGHVAVQEERVPMLLYRRTRVMQRRVRVLAQSGQYELHDFVDDPPGWSGRANPELSLDDVDDVKDRDPYMEASNAGALPDLKLLWQVREEETFELVAEGIADVQRSGRFRVRLTGRDLRALVESEHELRFVPEVGWEGPAEQEAVEIPRELIEKATRGR